MFWFFGLKAYRILTPWPGVEPSAPALEGEVLTTLLPGESCIPFNVSYFSSWWELTALIKVGDSKTSAGGVELPMSTGSGLWSEFQLYL